MVVMEPEVVLGHSVARMSCIVVCLTSGCAEVNECLLMPDKAFLEVALTCSDVAQCVKQCSCSTLLSNVGVVVIAFRGLPHALPVIGPKNIYSISESLEEQTCCLVVIALMPSSKR